MVTLEEPNTHRFALLHLGFRPFFILAGLFAVVSIAHWGMHLHFGFALLTAGAIPVATWHAHEMIYGYALAVLAGFLLTSVRNWTNIQTLHGLPLMLLVLCWLMARLLAVIDSPFALPLMMAFDLLFAAALCIAILLPLIKAKQWAQTGIWAKLCLLLLSNVLFYLGAFGIVAEGMRWGIYSGLYLVLSLILLMGRRVIPFFIEKGVDAPVNIKNYPWIDQASLWLMLAFWLVDVFFEQATISGLLAAALFVVHALRLYGWYTSAIWRKPLLWVLYLAYAWIVMGFLFKVLTVLGLMDVMLSMHAFAYGGIAMISAGMMARVSLGHTGRNVFDPPPAVWWIFALLLTGAIVRSVLPLLLANHYIMLLGISQLLWIAAFTIFLWLFAPVLLQPRVDGRFG